ncbi:DMT family transporter [Marinobacter similis]|uniref:ABC transporter permease n=1 Tax=Marinobacter similis TaxID=1420916 RepID=W5YGE0_9GAMM|nr:EamA family transporter [Marinobacter similis]AHI28075.1 ABC transporter permease [Marinobacter similis]
MTSPISLTMGLREWTLLLVLSLLWGGSFFFVGVAVQDLPPLTIVALRVSLAAVGLWCVVLILGLRPPRQWQVWLAFLGMGTINNAIPFSLIVWGQTQIASGLASILNATTPLFTVVVATCLLTDERATPLKVLGVVIGFLGVVVMIGLPASSEPTPWVPQLAILCAAMSYAFGGVYGRRFKALGVHPILTAAGQVTASGLIMMPIAMSLEGTQALSTASVQSWGAILGLALFSTSLAYIIYFKLLESAGATNLLLVTLLVPGSAILLGILFLNESITATQLAGLGLIALGLSAIDGRLWSRVVAARL